VEETRERLRRIGGELAGDRKTVEATYRRARKAANIAADEKISQRDIAELLGVDRMTVRKWVGKR
jgi:DNA-binding GntR family transcriptional regulator